MLQKLVFLKTQLNIIKTTEAISILGSMFFSLLKELYESRYVCVSKMLVL